MMLNEVNLMVLQQRNQDLLRQAERQRLISAVRRSGRGSQPAYRQAIGWLGILLVKLGARLQQYGGAPRPVSLPARRVIDLG